MIFGNKRDRSGGTSFFLSGLDRYIRWKKVAKRCTRIASLARETWHEIPAGRKRHSLPPSLFLSLSFSSDNTEFGPIRWNCCGPTGCLRRVYIYIYIYSDSFSEDSTRPPFFPRWLSSFSLALALSLLVVSFDNRSSDNNSTERKKRRSVYFSKFK